MKDDANEVAGRSGVLLVALLIAMAVLQGCATQVLQSTPRQSYYQGQLSAPVGGTFLRIERGTGDTAVGGHPQLARRMEHRARQSGD